MQKRKPALVVYAGDMPTEVNDWCCEHEINTHYRNDLVSIKDHKRVSYTGDFKNDFIYVLDENPLTEWLKTEIDDLEQYDYVGIIGT